MQMTYEEARALLDAAETDMMYACMTLAQTEVLRRGDANMPSPEEYRGAKETLRRMVDAKKTTYIHIDQLKTAAMLVTDPACCRACSEKNCLHRDNMKRLPRVMGGLAKCPNLAKA